MRSALNPPARSLGDRMSRDFNATHIGVPAHFRQQIRRRGEDEALVSGEVDVVAIDQNGTLKEVPAYLNQTHL